MEVFLIWYCSQADKTYLEIAILYPSNRELERKRSFDHLATNQLISVIFVDYGPIFIRQSVVNKNIHLYNIII
jgi:hypothetical protein